MAPTIVLVHGTCFQANCFDPLRSALASNNYETVARTLPSVGQPGQTYPGRDADAEFIREQLLAPLLDEGKDVVLVMHSYAGKPGSAAVDGLSREERAKQGKKGGLVGLVYLCAGICPEGENQADVWARLDHQMMGLYEPLEHDKRYICFKRERAIDTVFQDLTPQEAEHWVTHLQPFAAIAAMGEATYVAWSRPEWVAKCRYVETTDDKVFPSRIQKAMAGDMRRGPALDTGHAPMLSKPEETAKAIVWCIGDLQESG